MRQDAHELPLGKRTGNIPLRIPVWNTVLAATEQIAVRLPKEPLDEVDDLVRRGEAAEGEVGSRCRYAPLRHTVAKIRLDRSGFGV